MKRRLHPCVLAAALLPALALAQVYQTISKSTDVTDVPQSRGLKAMEQATVKVDWRFTVGPSTARDLTGATAVTLYYDAGVTATGSVSSATNGQVSVTLSPAQTATNGTFNWILSVAGATTLATAYGTLELESNPLASPQVALLSGTSLNWQSISQYVGTASAGSVRFSEAGFSWSTNADGSITVSGATAAAETDPIALAALGSSGTVWRAEWEAGDAAATNAYAGLTNPNLVTLQQARNAGSSATGDVAFAAGSGDNFRAGYGAGSIASGDDNFYGGDFAGYSASGNDNFYGGDRAGYSADGSYNFYGGHYAGDSAAGDDNFYGGYSAGDSAAGNYNFYGGRYAGYSAAGNDNFYGGYFAGYNSTTTNSTFLGRYAGRNATGNNWLFMDAYPSDPGGSHNPTNDSIVIDGNTANLYLGRPTGTLNLRGTVLANAAAGTTNAITSAGLVDISALLGAGGGGTTNILEMGSGGETDTGKVLLPDGTGGVEWGAIPAAPVTAGVNSVTCDNVGVTNTGTASDPVLELAAPTEARLALADTAVPQAATGGWVVVSHSDAAFTNAVRLAQTNAPAGNGSGGASFSLGDWHFAFGTGATTNNNIAPVSDNTWGGVGFSRDAATLHDGLYWAVASEGDTGAQTRYTDYWYADATNATLCKLRLQVKDFPTNAAAIYDSGDLLVAATDTRTALTVTYTNTGARTWWYWYGYSQLTNAVYFDANVRESE